MARFLTGNNLNAEIENIFRDAASMLILISPFIKLHDRYKASLLSHKENDKLAMIVIFGKNEENLSRSMSLDDLNFFKQFPNIEIKYEKRLHAKYYANEFAAIITSMNLYSFSQDNNIEVGVLAEYSLFGNNSLDADAEKYFSEVINLSEPIFKKSPQYENTLLGLKKKYSQSKIEIDKIADFFSDRPDKNNVVKNNVQNQKQTGFCIRTAASIPFNKDKPLSPDAYKQWNKNPNNPENFCHFSGERSNGETSVAKPILYKNWKKASEIFGLKS